MININVILIGFTMFETKRKFLTLVENAMIRAKNAGFLVGDYVTIDYSVFKKNQEAKKWFDSISQEYRDAIKALSESEGNLRIAELNVDLPQHFFPVPVTGTEIQGRLRYATVYEEIAAVRWGSVVVVPVMALRIRKPDGNNLVPGRPKFKDNKITDHPVEVSTSGEEHNLPKSNTTIPSGVVKDGRSQIKKPTTK